MKRREFLKVLDSFGFKLLRRGKHEIWDDGKRRLVLPYGSEISEAAMKRFRSMMRKDEKRTW